MRNKKGCLWRRHSWVPGKIDWDAWEGAGSSLQLHQRGIQKGLNFSNSLFWMNKEENMGANKQKHGVRNNPQGGRGWR